MCSKKKIEHLNNLYDNLNNLYDNLIKFVVLNHNYSYNCYK